MPAIEAWQKIISGLLETPEDYKTVPKIKRDPLWFSARTDGHYIYIDNAIKEKPSSKLTGCRHLVAETIERV